MMNGKTAIPPISDRLWQALVAHRQIFPPAEAVKLSAQHRVRSGDASANTPPATPRTAATPMSDTLLRALRAHRPVLPPIGDVKLPRRGVGT